MDVRESESMSETEGGEVSRVDDPTHAEKSEAANLTSEASQASTDVEETPPKKRKLDPNFVLETPERRHLGEYPTITNGLFLGQTSQLRAFVDQVNATSVCATPCCSGKLTPVSVTFAGLGGALQMQYNCTGCSQRQLVFNSSVQHEASGESAIGLALQVAFIAAGCSYEQYKKVMANAFGVHAVTSAQFYKTVLMMHPCVKQILDEQCTLAKVKMKDKPENELGSFDNAVTTADGVWMTKGYRSQNFTYQVRDYLTGALLYYQHISQRGKDNICEDMLYEGTSKSMEGHAASVVFERAKAEGMNVSIHWMDKDSSAALAIGEHFPDAMLMLCGGHAARAHFNAVKIIQTKKRFTSDEVVSLQEKYPKVETALCHCQKRHTKGCGCISDNFLVVARSKFFRALVDAGTKPDIFAERMRNLPHHARDEHIWEGGQCDFHPTTLCSCGQCDDDVKCEGKPYRTKNVLSCPYHSLAYQIECEKRAKLASEVIHPVLGRGHTNQIEASHNVFIHFRPKHWHLTRTRTL